MDTGGILKNVSDYAGWVRTGVGWHGYEGILKNVSDYEGLVKNGLDWNGYRRNIVDWFRL